MKHTIELLYDGEWHTYILEFSDRQEAITLAHSIHQIQIISDVRVIDMMNGEIIYGYFTRSTKKE